eukprot:403364251
MLKVNSREWRDFIQRLEIIKTKSNREVLCINCWQMLNCKQKIKHLKKTPEHEKYLLTSTKYASEKQIIALAKAQNKYHQKADGDYVATPFGTLNRQFRDPINLILKDNQITNGMNTSLQNQIYKGPSQLTPQTSILMQSLQHQDNLSSSINNNHQPKQIQNQSQSTISQPTALHGQIQPRFSNSALFSFDQQQMKQASQQQINQQAQQFLQHQQQQAAIFSLESQVQQQQQQQKSLVLQNLGSLMQQTVPASDDASVNERITLLNQKLDSVVKVLQMLVQQDLLVSQNLAHLNNNFQSLATTQGISQLRQNLNSPPQSFLPGNQNLLSSSLDQSQGHPISTNPSTLSSLSQMNPPGNYTFTPQSLTSALIGIQGIPQHLTFQNAPYLLSSGGGGNYGYQNSGQQMSFGVKLQPNQLTSNVQQSLISQQPQGK